MVVLEVVRVCGKLHLLSDRALDDQRVDIVFCVIVSEECVTVYRLIIAKHGERGMVPLLHVSIEVCKLDLLDVVFERHVELAVVGF